MDGGWREEIVVIAGRSPMLYYIFPTNLNMSANFGAHTYQFHAMIGLGSVQL